MSDDDLKIRVLALHEDLRAARVLFDTDDDGPDQVSLAFTLAALFRFIDAFPDMKAEGLAWPLHALASALMDADEGKRHPLLAPRKVGHRTKHRLEEGTLRIWASIAVDLHMKAAPQMAPDVAKKLGWATRVVAQHLEKIGYRLSRNKKPTAGTLRNWRINVRDEGGDLTRRYRNQSERFECLKVDDIGELATRCLDVLTQLVRSSGTHPHDLEEIKLKMPPP